MTSRKHGRRARGLSRRSQPAAAVPLERRAAFRRRLLAWYARRGRDLPWRRTQDPYQVLVSEIMLQQTQVARVKEYYPRFLARYPTIASLAAARPSGVRETWAGLGYYARSRNLHRTARLVATRHNGQVPRKLEELRALPGIGPYTANAVRSFAFGEWATILDTNAARVYQRVFGVRGDRRRSQVARRLRSLAAAVTPRRRVYDFNQAIMDLGAMVCVARRPRCGVCPLRRMCRSVRA